MVLRNDRTIVDEGILKCKLFDIYTYTCTSTYAPDLLKEVKTEQENRGNYFKAIIH